MEIDSTVTAESPPPHEALGDLEQLDRPIPEGSDICVQADNIGRLHFYMCFVPPQHSEISRPAHPSRSVCCQGDAPV